MKNSERTAEIKRLRGEGKSIREIEKLLGCPRSVVSYHCKGTPKLPQKHSPAGTKGNKKAWQNRVDQVVAAAKSEWPQYRTDPDFMGFLGLYWGEGGKATKSIASVTNNDPLIVSVACRWFQRLSDRAPFAQIVYYDSHNVDECQAKWDVSLPGVKLLLRANSDKRSKSKWCQRCPYGRCKLSVCDYRLYWRLMTWLDCWREELSRDAAGVAARLSIE